MAILLSPNFHNEDIDVKEYDCLILSEVFQSCRKRSLNTIVSYGTCSMPSTYYFLSYSKNWSYREAAVPWVRRRASDMVVLVCVWNVKQVPKELLSGNQCGFVYVLINKWSSNSISFVTSKFIHFFFVYSKGFLLFILFSSSIGLNKGRQLVRRSFEPGL